MLNAFQIDDKNVTTNNICEKCVQIFKMDDSSVSHQPVYKIFLGRLTGVSSAWQSVETFLFSTG